MLDQSYYGSQLVYAVGYFFFPSLKASGEEETKKNLENWNLTCLIIDLANRKTTKETNESKSTLLKIAKRK